MPLKKGQTRAIIKANIQELVKSGHPLKQALAISLKQARKRK